MPFNPDNFSSLEQQNQLKIKTGLEGFYTPEFQKTLQQHPKPFVSILQDDPTAYKTIADIIGEDRAREIQAKQPPQTEKNPDTYSEDPTTAQIQKAIYENLGINVKTDSNSFLKKLIKGCVDGLVVGNVELIEQIKKRGLGAFLGEIVTQFTSTEGWKKIFSKIGDDVGNIFSFDAYKTGKTGSEYIGMIGGAGLAGWALKKGGKAVVETGVKAAIKAEGKTITSSTLETTGQGMIKTGEVLQVPYKAVEKATGATINTLGKGVKAGAEAVRNLQGVQQVTSAVKGGVATILANQLHKEVGSRNIPSSIRNQIGAAGDIDKVKPFEKGEGKPPIVEEPKIKEETTNPIEGKTQPVLMTLEELSEIGVPKKYIEAIQEIGISETDIARKYQNWQKDPKFKQLVEGMAQKYGMTLEEAHSVYGYTLGFFNQKLNMGMREGTLQNSEMAKYLLSGIEKMPQAPSVIQFIGDSHNFGGLKKGDTKMLDWFTSSSNPSTEPFWSGGKYQITVRDSTRAKDISDLAYFVNFAKNKTEQESLFLPGTKLEILKVEPQIGPDGKMTYKILASQLP